MGPVSLRHGLVESGLVAQGLCCAKPGVAMRCNSKAPSCQVLFGKGIVMSRFVLAKRGGPKQWHGNGMQNTAVQRQGRSP